MISKNPVPKWGGICCRSILMNEELSKWQMSTKMATLTVCCYFKLTKKARVATKFKWPFCPFICSILLPYLFQQVGAKFAMMWRQKKSLNLKPRMALPSSFILYCCFWIVSFGIDRLGLQWDWKFLPHLKATRAQIAFVNDGDYLAVSRIWTTLPKPDG